jgi:sugar phosphate isomerase/epimerase
MDTGQHRACLGVARLSIELGLKASKEDTDPLLEMGPAFLETFLGPNDLVKDFQGTVDAFQSTGLPIVVHVPELEGDLFIDLSSMDAGVRRSSIAAVTRTLAFADAVDALYVIVHPGGFGAPDGNTKKRLVENLRGSLKGFDRDDLYIENMPWFYVNHKDERGTCMVMVRPDDLSDLKDLVAGMCLDVSHAFLSTEQGGMADIMGFIEGYPGIRRHLHISDAKAPAGEGLQIGEGNVDIQMVLGAIANEKVLGIPEIMDGHLDQGKGFKVALEMLRAMSH